MGKNANCRHSFMQQEIVESARRIISAKGIENLTIRQIARDPKLTDGALYRHFKSKKEIISLLIDDIEKTLLDTIDDAAKMSGEPCEKLKNILSIKAGLCGTGEQLPMG